MASFKKGISSIDYMTDWIVSGLTKLYIKYLNVGNHHRGYLMNNLYTHSHIEMSMGFIFNYQLIEFNINIVELFNAF